MSARPISRGRQAWNKGLLIGQKKPLEPRHVWSIRVRLEIARSRRDLAIFNLAIDSKLRACDLVKLRVDDICSGTNVRRRATIIQKKTGSRSALSKAAWAFAAACSLRSRFFCGRLLLGLLALTALPFSLVRPSRFSIRPLNGSRTLLALLVMISGQLFVDGPPSPRFLGSSAC